jgi:hypothetical protein
LNLKTLNLKTEMNTEIPSFRNVFNAMYSMPCIQCKVVLAVAVVAIELV